MKSAAESNLWTKILSITAEADRRGIQTKPLLI